MTRQPSASRSAWSKGMLIAIFSGGSALLVAVATLAFFLLRGDGGRSEALALTDQLLQAADDVPAWERNKTLTQLMRTIDEMDREKRRELQEHWRSERQAHMEAVLTEYREAANLDKNAILDREIQYFVKTRDVDAAFNPGFPRGAGRGRGGGRRGGGGRGGRQERQLSPQQQERMAFWQALEARAVKTGIALYE